MLRSTALSILCLSLSLAAAEPGVVNGDFETIADGWASGWTRGDPAFISLAEDGGNHFVRFTLNQDGAATSAQRMPLDPNWAKIDVSLRIRADHLARGSEGWMTGRLEYLFHNQAGQHVGGWPWLGLQQDGSTDGWITLRAEGVEVPASASSLNLALGMWGATGRVDIDDLSVQPHSLRQSQQTGPEPINEHRARLSLDGEWQFLPGRGPAGKEPTTDGWGRILVPGSWHEDLVAAGSGGAWDGFDPKATNKAWYQRSFEVPADWRGRAVELRFDRISTDAQVWVNGKDAGQVRWPWGVMDIAPLLDFGATNSVRVMVLSMNDRSEVVHFMGYVDEPTSKAELGSRGIIGSVSLLARPSAGHLQDLLVRPSVREQRLELDLELVAAITGTLQVSAEMLDEEGQVERSFTATTEVEQAGEQTVTVAFPWADPRLWDYRQPNRYTMVLAVSGAGIEDGLRQDFGFREFWIEGRKFFLNGSEIRLRPGNIQYGVKPEHLLAQHMNFGHHWPEDQIRRGQRSDYDLKSIEQADRSGLLVDANLAHMRWHTDHWDDPEIRAEYERIIAQQVRLYRNHPSVVMYTHSANAFQWQGDGDPWDIGMRDTSSMQEYAISHGRVQEAIDLVKAIDPKPVYAHFGSYNGDVHSSNLYLNFLQLQEREEWLSIWARDGQMPYMVVEMGLPLYSSVMRGRNGYTHQGHSEPFPTEWSAALLGPKAYAEEQGDLRRMLEERFRKGNPQQAYEPHIRHDHMDRMLVDTTALDEVLDLFVTNTWRSWRSMGITGGMIPWHHDDLPALERVNGPSLAWIAGPGGIPDQQPGADEPLTAKTHHYRPGETLRKQLILINDYREAKPFSGSLRATLGEQVLLEQELSGELTVSEIRHQPLEIALPRRIQGERLRGTLELRLRIGEQDHVHDFAFDVIAAPDKSRLQISAFDPEGSTSAYLEALGYRIVPWTEGAPGTDVALIGRNALSAGEQLPVAISDWVADGGRLLVMAQDPAWLANALHLRTAPQATRRVFPIDPAHPVVAGLDSENLRDWNGSGSLLEAYPSLPGLETTPAYGWRWGNRHSVSSAPIEKPHRGAWRPLLECEFDLAYSPLLELEHGAGRVTLCTLDLEGRSAADPAADRLATQVLAHVASGEIQARRPVHYLGGEAGAEQLTQLGVVFSRTQQLPTPDALLVLGGDAQVADAPLQAFLQAGGRALALRREQGSGPLGLRLVQRKDFFGSQAVPRWPEAAGLGAGDLRWRGEHGAWLVTDSAGAELAGNGQLARIAIGKGVLIAAQLGPDAVPADERHYLRFTRWRQTRALSQLLTNLGASFEQDRRFLELLHRPDHYLGLAGTDWKAQNTITLPESPTRQWQGFQPISEQAKQLVQPEASTDDMQQVSVPAYMESYGDDWRWVDGETVFRFEFDWPEHAAGKRLFLSLGRVDEHELTFFNGSEIGSSRHWILPRGHYVPAELVKPGRNVLAVRHWDEGIHGGICGSPNQIYLRVAGEDPGFYHGDHLSDDVSDGTDEATWHEMSERWKIADNPYRYYRW